MSEVISLLEFLIIVYLSIVLIYIHFKHVSTQEAFEVVGRKTLEYLNKFFNQWNEPAEPVPFRIDEGCLNDLLYAVCEFSMIEKDYTIWKMGGYSKYNLPSICIELSPKNGEKDFPALSKNLINIIDKHLIEYGIERCERRVLFKKINDSTYNVYIVYAITDNDIENFTALLLAYRKYQKWRALNAKKPIIDPKLENELSKMEENDGEI